MTKPERIAATWRWRGLLSKQMKTTPIKFSIHADGDDPVLSETAIFVEIQDEGAGKFFEVSSMESDKPVRLDQEDVLELAKLAEKLLKEQKP